MKIEGNIWLVGDNGFLLGKGKVMLLEMIQSTGTITQAAKELNISYRKAWAMVNDINLSSSRPLVNKCSGGKYGGATVLTQEGKEMIEKLKSRRDGLLKNGIKYYSFLQRIE